MFLSCSFLNIPRKLLLKAIKKLNENGKYQEKSCDLWFPLPDMKINLKQQSEKVISAKIYGLKRASTAKLYSGIRRFFAKHLKMGFFRLIAESMILQHSFSKEPYQYLIHQYYIPTVHSNYYESLLKSLLENQIFL